MPDRESPRFYGRRHGRPLRPERRRLMEEVLPSLSLSADAPIPELQSSFAVPVDDVWMEIGFGGGEHLAGLAAANPRTGFVGCEPFVNGVASMLSLLTDDSRDRVRVFADDARRLLPLLPADSIARLYVMFPDPWPKKRHNRRRLVTAETLDELARVVKPGGLFRFASDHMEYIRWALFEVRRHGAFEWVDDSASDWRRRFPDSPATRYETKALGKGCDCAYLTFRRLG